MPEAYSCVRCKRFFNGKPEVRGVVKTMPKKISLYEARMLSGSIIESRERTITRSSGDILRFIPYDLCIDCANSFDKHTNSWYSISPNSAKQ